MNVKYLILFFISFMIFNLGCTKTYNVTFDANGGQINGEYQFKVSKNQKIDQINEPTKEGYKFIGWYCQNKEFDFNQKINQDLTIVANWEKLQTFIITFDTDSIYKINQLEVYVASLVKLPIPIKEDYTFIGWYENDILYDNEIQINRNLHLKAKWEKKSYQITYQLDGGTNHRNNPESFTSDDMINLYTPIKDGYIFLGWYNEDLQEIKTINGSIKENLTLFAKWEIKELTVVFATNCDISLPVVKIKYGEILEKPEPLEYVDHQFIYWEYMGEEYDFSKPVKSNMRLEAIWKITKEGLYNYLNSLIPDIALTDLTLPTKLENSNISFIWTSDNRDVITDEGKVNRLDKDYLVKLKVLIIDDNMQEELEYEVKVPMIDLKPLKKGKIVSGYLGDFGSFGNLPDKMIEQLDLINYSFGYISNGCLKVNETNGLKNVLNYRNQGVRVVLAIGGWGADGFSQAVRTKQTRTVFIQSIIKIIKQYQFDGIDIDWEYPGSSVAQIESHPSDRENLTLFCQELKQEMLKYRQDLILSIAIAGTNRYYDLASLNQYIDIFNVMTYDFAMGNVAKHDSNLYSTALSSSSLDQAVKTVMQYVDSNKIVPGAAFYVRNGIFESEKNQNLGASLKTSMATNPLGYNQFVELLNNNPSIIESYDESSEAAYTVFDGKFYSYDNPRSIKAKCDYVKKQNLGGLMCWELTTDYIDENGFGVLVDAMYKNLK